MSKSTSHAPLFTETVPATVRETFSVGFPLTGADGKQYQFGVYGSREGIDLIHRVTIKLIDLGTLAPAAPGTKIVLEGFTAPVELTAQVHGTPQKPRVGAGFRVSLTPDERDRDLADYYRLEAAIRSDVKALLASNLI